MNDLDDIKSAWMLFIDALDQFWDALIDGPMLIADYIYVAVFQPIGEFFLMVFTMVFPESEENPDSGRDFEINRGSEMKHGELKTDENRGSKMKQTILSIDWGNEEIESLRVLETVEQVSQRFAFNGLAVFHNIKGKESWVVNANLARTIWVHEEPDNDL